MDENVIEIKKQVRKIIELLEQRIILEPNRPIIKTLYVYSYGLQTTYNSCTSNN